MSSEIAADASESAHDIDSPEFDEMIEGLDDIIWDGAKLFLKVLKESADAFPPLKAAVGGFVAIIDLYSAKQDNTAALKDAASRLNRLMRILATRLAGNQKKAAQFMQERCVRNLRGALIKLDDIQHKSTWARVFQSAQQTQEIKNICDTVAQSIEELQLKIGISVEKDTKEIVQESIFQYLKRARSAAYTAAMPPNGPQARRSCTENTRTKIVENILSWARDEPGRDGELGPVYWVSGLAGQGKTTIAYTICERLEKETKEFATISFFCSRQLDSHEERLLVSTIAFELAECSASYASALRDVVRSTHNLSDQTLSVQMSRLLLEPWGKSAPQREGLRPIIVVVDALDENDAGVEFIKHVLSAVEGGKLQGLRILFTSRPEPQIKKLCDSDGSIREHTICRLNDVLRCDVNQDITTYLRHELPEFNQGEDSKLLENLATLSAGLFIYASTAVRWIKPSRRALARSEQTGRLKAIIRRAAAVGSSAGLLDDLYKSVMIDAFRELNDEEKEVRLRILIMMVCSSQAIHPEFATIVEGVEADLVQLAIDALYAVMYVGKEGHVLWYHASFQDYILTTHKVSVKPTQVHIIRRCWEESTRHISEQTLLANFAWGVHPLDVDESTVKRAYVDDAIRRCQKIVRGFKDLEA